MTLKEIESRIKSDITVDEETGKLFWKETGRGRIGVAAGNVMKRGYRRVGIGKKILYAHRIAFFLYHGRWPYAQIDHINGNKDDNRKCNLADCSSVENLRGFLPIASKSGYRGVHKDAQRGIRSERWIAIFRGKHLGSFSSIERAAMEWDAAARNFGYRESAMNFQHKKLLTFTIK